MELKKPIIDGLLLGTSGGLALGIVKRLANRVSDQISLSKLHKVVKKELAKRDVALEGGVFRDANPAYEEKKANIDLSALPEWAALIASGGIGAGLGLYTSNMFEKDDKDSVPAFATKYKRLKEQKFKRAAKLLRAVTDPATMREYAKNKQAFIEKKAWIWPALGLYGIYKGTQAARYAGDKIKEGIHEGVEAFNRAKEDTLKPIAITGGIAALGGLGLYGVNKLLKRQAKDKTRQSASKNAINAWLADRKEMASADRELNTFIRRPDADERHELNRILEEYEKRYQRKKKKNNKNSSDEDED